jgi:hypothetical protein
MSETSEYLPSEKGMIGLMWDLAEKPSEVIDYYCGFVVMALMDRNVVALHKLLANVELPSTTMMHNGWIEADTLKRIIEHGLSQLETRDP